jgi:GNAT superfamily N-acetyltransferase
LLLSLVKTSTDDGGDRRLAREAQWLRELADIPSLEGQVPRLLEEGWRDGRRFLVLSLAQGSAQETRAFTADHARFLASLGKARFRVADFEVAGCCRWLQRAIANLSSLNSNQQTQDQLRAAYHDCESALLYWTGPYVLSQGEFAPWNIRNFGAQLFVYDWGRAHADASPLDDVLHYLMVQRALRRQPIGLRFLRAAMRRAHGFAQQAYPEWAWRPRVIGALTLVYLLGAVLHHARQTGVCETSACWRLLENRAAWMPD